MGMSCQAHRPRQVELAATQGGQRSHCRQHYANVHVHIFENNHPYYFHYLFCQPVVENA